jgi:hypothetical protein
MTIYRNGFQTFVNQQPPPAVVGDFASQNPRAVALAGPGAFRADSAAPVIVGNFAWGVESTQLAYGSEQSNSVLGFVANELQSVITDFLGQSRLSVQAGFPVTLFTHGDFWAYVAGGVVAVGDSIFADAATGAPTVDDDSNANPDTGYVAATPLAADASFTGVIAAGTGVLTVSALTGVVQIGANVSGTGVPTNLFIQSQLTGAAGAAGTYQLNTIGPAVGSTAMTSAVGKLVKITRTF